MSRWLLMTVLVVSFLLLLGAGLWVGLPFFISGHARNYVGVSITHLPDEVYFTCVASEVHGKLHVMKWYEMGIPGDYTEDPVNVGYYPGGVGHDVTSTVAAWVFGDRYAILSRTKGGSWYVTWFEADAVPLEGRSLLTGGGTATFDIPKGRTEALPDADVKALGLQKVRGSGR